VLLNATAKLDEAGNIVHTRGSVLDITEKEAADEALKNLALELSQQKQALEQKNSALRELLAQIEIEKNHIKDEVMANVEKLILPILTKLRRRMSGVDRQHLGLLEDNLKQLTSAFGRSIGEHQWQLTPKEIEICDMVKNGLSTKEIASLLCSSCRTVDNHRNRIRKKLNITQKDINLSSYLLSLNRTER
jgi:DNA-binding CsgD family transcriptional regulator